MQLLDSEQLEFAFQLHGITLEAQARQFYMNIWQTIQDAEKASDGAELQAKDRILRHLCQGYFSVVRDWRIEEQDRTENMGSCSISRDNMREAQDALPLFEKQFYRYALCYMELNRALIRTRAKIAHFAKDQTLDMEDKSMAVNHGTGVLLSRAHAEMADLQKKRKKLEDMKILLQDSDPLMEELGAALPGVLGSEGDHQLTLFKGALRRREFSRAEKIVKDWRSDRLRATGAFLVSLFSQKAADLGLQGILVLHSGELTLPSTILRSDEKKVEAFLEKFNVPYMLFQYRVLLNLGYMLGKIGSIEALIIQHAKMASLAVRPQSDADLAYKQQQTVLMPVRTLMETRFRTLGPIFNEMETTLATLERFFSQTRDYMASRTI